MDLSIFEIIGPVMIGPSSSHTAGMARIGLMVREIIGSDPIRLLITLHPAIRNTYKGHRTDMAIVGGILGIGEDDPEIRKALIIASERGIEVEVNFLKDASLNPNTVRIETLMPTGDTFNITGISVGGGSILISEIDGLQTKLTGSEKAAIIWSKDDIQHDLDRVLSIKAEQKQMSKSGMHIYLYHLPDDINRKEITEAAKVDGHIKHSIINPILQYGIVKEQMPLFTNFADLLVQAEEKNLGIHEMAINYEVNRSGKSAEEVLRRMRLHWKVMLESSESGLKDEIVLNFGLTSGKDGKKLFQAIQERKTLGGKVIPMAIARALGVMEVNGSMGRVVASPTAGSSGVIPGCLVTIVEDRQLTDEHAVNALLVSAIVGVIIAQRGASFSGVVGGCQSEIGVSSALAAAGLVYLGGGNAEQIINGAALALKNTLGLICDPIAGPVEVPCIKRNAIGVANAFAAADMALAGIQSFIPADEVVDALINTQKLLPPELKGTTSGGLACTATAIKVREWLNNV